MLTFREIFSLKKEIAKAKSEGKTVGFVPTMGNLHEGHLSLLRKCVEQNALSVLSIYVNPAQFGPDEDLDKYPRTLEKDLKLAKETGCNFVFLPDNSIMYPEGYSTYIIEEKLTLPMEGKVRPGHFKGVATIVLKLFNIIEPHVSYLGQKDAQQALIIKKMVKDLNINTEIHVLPTIREKNGLAMSSRNNYLNQNDKEKASIIYKSLMNAQNLFKSGENGSNKIIEEARKTLAKEKDIIVDYIEIRSTENLEHINEVKSESLLAVAASLNNVHLIDNIVLKP